MHEDERWPRSLTHRDPSMRNSVSKQCECSEEPRETLGRRKDYAAFALHLVVK